MGTVFADELNINIDNPFNLQIGPNAGNLMEAILPSTFLKNLHISNLSVSNRKNAENSITKLDTAIEYISKERARMGSYQNRLEHSKNLVKISGENLSNANSKIEDTDMAKEFMNMTKINILSQSAQAILSQSNFSKENILKLLQ